MNFHRYRAPIIAHLLCGSLLGCELEGSLNGLAKELGNPEKDNFDTPGDLLLEGSYSYPSIEGNSSSGAFIASMSSEGYLTLVEFESKKSCKLGPLAAYRPPPRKDTENGSATPADILLPVLLRAGEDTPQRLAFSDLRCKKSSLTLDTPYFPLHDSFADNGSLVAQDAEGGVWQLDPRAGTKERVAENTIPLSGESRVLFAEGEDGSRRMYTVENGEIVGRNSKFKEVFRAATGIDGLIFHKDARGSAVLLARTMGSNWLSIPLADPESAVQIAENACLAKIYDGDTARQFFWVDCETFELRQYDFGTEKVTVWATNVRNYRVMNETDTGPLLMYLDREGAVDGDVGPLYAQWGEDSPVFLGENGNLRLSWVDRKGTQRPLVDWDVEGKVGTLKYAAPGKSLATVAKKVVYLSSLGVISDYDGSNGKFSRLTDDELTLVHEHVHSRGFQADPDKNRERLLVSANLDEDGAELTLISGTKSTLKVAEHAMVGNYGFSINASLISVLTDPDPELNNIGTLRMVNIERSTSQVISKGVLHALETTWPEEGILYSAPYAEVPGLYFARATR